MMQHGLRVWCSLVLLVPAGCGTPTYWISDSVMRRAAALPASQQARAVVPALRVNEDAEDNSPPQRRLVRYQNVAGHWLAPDDTEDTAPSGYSLYQNRGAAVPANPLTGRLLTGFGAFHLLTGTALFITGLAIPRSRSEGEITLLAFGISGAVQTVIGLSIGIPGVLLWSRARKAREALPRRPDLIYLTE